MSAAGAHETVAERLGADVPIERLLRSILMLRAVEERFAAETSSGGLRGSVLHVGIGQEAVAAGVGLARRDGDVLLSTHRGVAHCLMWGCDLGAVAAEVFGRRSGLGRGLVGHMHLVDPDHAVLGTNGVVGGGLPIAVGAAYALQLSGDNRCVVAFFGDGAANTGAMHEALNLAAVWSVPVLFVCENNGYQEMTRSAGLTAGSVVERAAAYGIPARAVDGADAVEVYSAATHLLTSVRSNSAPALLECDTYRVDGHWVGDPQHYRSADERAARESRDPLPRLIARAGLDSTAAEALRVQVAAGVNPVIDEALRSARPTAADLLDEDAL
jgi:TPP-dependent pyruvate/acetoin dehydrogenase alpha subunit